MKEVQVLCVRLLYNGEKSFRFFILCKETFSIQYEKKENIERAKIFFSSVSKKEKEFFVDQSFMKFSFCFATFPFGEVRTTKES